MPKYLLSKWIILLTVIATIIVLILIKQRHQVVIVDIPKYAHSITPNPSSATSTDYSLPTTHLLPVPFTTQAPNSNWDKIHNEDCEEASAIMANAYYNGPFNTNLNTDYVEELLTKLTEWELKTFGYNLDINSQETVQMIVANFNLHAKLVNNFSEIDIKNELAQNHLVLLPENGQMLKNPNYKQPGPIYHMIVIRGWTSSTIITNDPGTRNGLNYNYSFDTLYNANGTFDHSTDKVDLSKKNIIVVSPR